ncbi:AraC family transcriptional regulator [Algibacter agarivorans]
MFEHSNVTINIVSYNLGFSDRCHFSRGFKSISGISPAVYIFGRYT